MSHKEEDLAAEIMCACTGTTRGKIFDLVTEGFDFETISRKTGVNTGCGGCECEVECFIDALQEDIK
jgi:bacterioferritin-associated ferredoxin